MPTVQRKPHDSLFPLNPPVTHSDLTLFTNLSPGTPLHIHKAVFVTACPLFRSVLQEACPCVNTSLILPGVPHSTLQLLVEWLYLGKVVLGTDQELQWAELKLMLGIGGNEFRGFQGEIESQNSEVAGEGFSIVVDCSDESEEEMSTALNNLQISTSVNFNKAHKVPFCNVDIFTSDEDSFALANDENKTHFSEAKCSKIPIKDSNSEKVLDSVNSGIQCDLSLDNFDIDGDPGCKSSEDIAINSENANPCLHTVETVAHVTDDSFNDVEYTKEVAADLSNPLETETINDITIFEDCNEEFESDKEGSCESETPNLNSSLLNDNTKDQNNFPENYTEEYDCKKDWSLERDHSYEEFDGQKDQSVEDESLNCKLDCSDDGINNSVQKDDHDQDVTNQENSNETFDDESEQSVQEDASHIASYGSDSSFENNTDDSPSDEDSSWKASESDASSQSEEENPGCGQLQIQTALSLASPETALMTMCRCKGSCIRNCACRTGGQECSTQCKCLPRKCKWRAEPEKECGNGQIAKEVLKVSPAGLASDQDLSTPTSTSRYNLTNPENTITPNNPPVPISTSTNSMSTTAKKNKKKLFTPKFGPQEM